MNDVLVTDTRFPRAVGPAVIVALAFLAPLRLASGRGQSAPTRPAPVPPVPAATVTGEVLGLDGKPAAGAVVRFHRWTAGTLPHQVGMLMRDATVEVAKVSCDAQGRFRASVPEGQLLVAHAEQGDAAVSDAIGPFGPGDSLGLRLQPARVLRGRTLRAGADGKERVPVAGCTVSVRLPTAPCHVETPLSGQRALWLETRSGADGAFALAVPDRPGTEAVAMAMIGTQLVSGTGDLVAEAPVRKSGQVIDKATRKPAAGVRIRTMWSQTHEQAVSDSDGRFAIDTTGDTYFLVTGPGYRRQVVTQDAIAAAGEPAPPPILLTKGRKLTARFLRADGTPVASARVLLAGSVQEDGMGYAGVESMEATDADGWLRLGCLQENVSITGYIELDGVWSVFVSEQIGRDVDLGEVRVIRSARIEGRVIGPGGGPVPGAVVLLLPPPREGARGDVEGPPPVRTIVADRQGRFVGAELQPGAWRLMARAHSFAPGHVTVDTAKGAPVTIRLGVGAELRGRVVGEDGKGIARASVQGYMHDQRGDVARFGMQEWDAVTDPEGGFVLRGLPAEATLHLNAQIRVADQWVGGSQQNVPVGGDVVEITVKRQ